MYNISSKITIISTYINKWLMLLKDKSFVWTFRDKKLDKESETIW